MIIEKDGIEYLIMNKKAIIMRYLGNEENVVIPSKIKRYNVTEIANSAFKNCNIKSIIIPRNVTTMGEDAFRYCNSLTIYCEVSHILDGWDKYWNSSSCIVVWGCKNEDILDKRKNKLFKK